MWQRVGGKDVIGADGENTDHHVGLQEVFIPDNVDNGIIIIIKISDDGEPFCLGRIYIISIEN